MSLKKPFQKSRRLIERHTPTMKNQQTNQDKFHQQEQNTSVKGPPINFGSKKKNIYKALKDHDDEKKQQSQIHKSINLKPSFKKKDPKLLNNEKSPINNQNNDQTQPKFTPLRPRKHKPDLKRKSHQKVIIQEDAQQMQNESNGKKQIKQGKSKPNMKIKRHFQRQEPNESAVGQSNQLISNQNNYSKHQQNSPQLQQQITQSEQQGQKKPSVNIQAREINFQKIPQQVSKDKLEKQDKRNKDLKNILNLEIDIYEPLLSISPTTSYEIYIGKIKSGYLKNSNDQAFDEKKTNSSQTLSYQCIQFTNQCPEDYNNNYIDKHIADNSEQALNQFILQVSPIIQELIRPSHSVTMPPISLLAFRPIFRSFRKNPYPIFIYDSQEFDLGLIVIGQKLYIAECFVKTVMILSSIIVGGLKNGTIAIWSGVNNKQSRLYETIYSMIGSTNFELPSYINNNLQQLSLYASYGQIVSLIACQNSNFYSLDENCKLVKWELDTSHNNFSKITLQGKKVTQFNKLVQKSTLIAYNLKQRANILYLLTSIGIIVWNGNIIQQIIDTSFVNIIDFQVPKRSSLIYAISQDHCLKIYQDYHSQSIFSMVINESSSLYSIIVPEVQHNNQQISVLYHFYLIDSAGIIYQINLLENQIQQLDRLQNIKDQKAMRNIIFKSAHALIDQIQIIKLEKDLKCHTSVIKMKMNLQNNVTNLKKIIQNNRNFNTKLEKQIYVL